MRSEDIRQAFIDFFAARGHQVVPSSPVVPADDPTLLFTNAGMVQFKNVFLGLEKRDYTRAVSCQKCIRAGGKHNDLDQVGLTARHQTFFEMLGNFSFGDYFKKEAIAFAWEFVTETLRLDPERLYVTIFQHDDEAEKYWRAVAPQLGDRILRFGEKDNLWAMGDTGPCGPCSEIHFDRGPEIPGELNGEGDRFVEIWNLVFMQYNRDDEGKMTPLPKPSVDTGAGLERLCMILQETDSNFTTDLFRPLIDKICELSGRPYDSGPDGIPHRVIADHLRTLAFAIADNAVISNEGRGYVLRRILRRAARHGYRLGLGEPFLYRLAPVLIKKMGHIYPELQAQRAKIELMIKSEEEQFDRTLSVGMERFEELATQAQQSGGVIAGRDVFRLYDTYGFPADLTETMAQEKGLTIDWPGFERELEQQKARSRAAGRFVASTLARVAADKRTSGKQQFVYDRTELETVVLASEKVEDDDEQTWHLVLETTPFYAESGGQVGDTGFLSGPGFSLRVEDTQKLDGEHVHVARLQEGSFPEDYRGPIKAQIDTARRAEIQRHHTATHLLHRALKMVLGEHVHQSGSLVAPDRLRFDFTHYRPLTTEEIEQVEQIVQEKIDADLPVTASVMPLEQAKKSGAVALFGEKYGDMVRVVQAQGFSSELCGGTHVSHTGDIGDFFIISESGIAAGVRRIEALCGEAARNFRRQQAELIEKVQEMLAVSAKNPTQETVSTLKEVHAAIHPRLLSKQNLTHLLEETIEQLEQQQKREAQNIIKSIQSEAAVARPQLDMEVNGRRLLVYCQPDLDDSQKLLAFFDGLKAAFPQATVMAIAKSSGQYALFSPDYAFACAVLDELKRSVSAKGGGKPTIRGSIATEKIDEALRELERRFGR